MKKPVKQRIVEACILVMREEGDAASVSIRKIAKKAGIGVGLINYHFQSKQNLIGQCVRIFIGKAIAQWGEIAPRQKKKPEEHLVGMLSAAAQFLADYPKISRISILQDMQHPADDDNTGQTVAGIMPVLCEMNARCRPPQILKREAYLALFSIQAAFLRAGPLAAETGFDFYDPKQRRQLVCSIVDRLVTNISTEV